MAKKYSVLLGNKLVSESTKKLEVRSPGYDQVIAELPVIESNEEINKIFELANKRFKTFKFSSVEERESKLLKFCDLLEENKEKIANILVREIAKNKSDSIKEVTRSIEYIKETIKEYKKIIDNPLILDEDVHHIKNKTGAFIYQPIGVILAISPFNYPVNLLISKIAPALISGNTIVYKPATQGSIVGSFISELLFTAGFNNNEVFCVIGSSSEIGDSLVTNKHVKMISFTGSTKVGEHIAKVTSKVRLVLEMGGKDAAIVLEDANLELAAQEIIIGAFSYNGQRCTAIKRVLVHKNKYEELVKILNEKLSNLTIGFANSDDNVFITELISEKSLKYNFELIVEAIKHGAKTQQELKYKGNLLWPVILYDVNLNSRIAWEEPFGPILPIIKFDTIEEAINITNKSEFGLQASIFTKDMKLAKDIGIKLEVGTVNINRSSSRSPDIFPFLGVKSSGFGVQGIKDAILSMNEIKGIIFNK